MNSRSVRFPNGCHRAIDVNADSRVLTAPPPGASADWTIPQAWSGYSADEHATWDRLFARQAAMLPGRVVPDFLAGLDILRLSKPGIPDFAELSDASEIEAGTALATDRICSG